jgi:predicted Zn-dependent protease
MKKHLLVLGFFLLASSHLRAQQDDVEARAMRDEMQRSMKQLHLEGMDGPYYIAYKIVDAETLEARASLGSLVSSGESRSRILSVSVRVGSYELDNTNFSPAGGGLAALLGSLASGNTVLPVDDSYDELRRKIWLATDFAYKKAVEDLSAKKAALLNKNRDEKVPDFSKMSPHQESETLPLVHEKLADAEHLVRTASAVFRTLPSVEASEAQFEVGNTTEHFLNSEGTTYVRQIPTLYFQSSASMQNVTGEIFRDSYSAYGRSLTELPSETALVQGSQDVVDRLTARRKGHVAKRYNGPVLFEGQSAAELFGHNFAPLLSSRMHSGGEGGSLLALLTGANTTSTSSMLNKVGSRVLPEFLTVVDNPQLTQAEGHTLFGNYKFDEEGTPSQETVLIQDGFLKTLLTSRAPVRGMLQSTGNMRERGILAGNLFLNTTKSASTDELKAQLIDLLKARNLEFGIIVRRLSGNIATECSRVYPDGHEEALRDARVAEVTASSFKDILAVSKDRTVYTERVAANSLAGLLSHGDLITYVVPDMLFEDMTVEHVPNESPKLPDIPSPLASN